MLTLRDDISWDKFSQLLADQPVHLISGSGVQSASPWSEFCLRSFKNTN